MLIQAIKENFAELTDLVGQLSPEEYCRPCAEISDATIGQHIRHILEMYQCLDKSYLSGEVEYDARQRDLLLQTVPEVALQAISRLQSTLEKKNKPMTLRFSTDGHQMQIPTNYERELLYNLEHSIHHQALIKVAIRNSEASVSDSFGVAKSTLAYRKQCAQ